MTDREGLDSAASGRPVFLFSGQGAQKPGMGEDLFDIAEVASTLECASDIVGYDIVELVRGASAEQLNDTRTAQSVLCALSVGIAHALEGRGVSPAAVLGFSLGQVSALAIAGMLSDEDTFSLVKVRADVMARAAAERAGAMSALLKADEESVRDLCEKCAEDDVLVPANFNCPGQIVISGDVAAVERAEEAWGADGGRFSRLATSGAFHSPLMAGAADELAAYLEGVEFSEAHVPLVCNVDAKPLSAEDVRDHLVRHLTHPVLFEQSVTSLIGAGSREFVEVGYGGVLTGLVRRIDKGVERMNVQDKEGYEKAVARYGDKQEGSTS